MKRLLMLGAIVVFILGLVILVSVITAKPQKKQTEIKKERLIFWHSFDKEYEKVLLELVEDYEKNNYDIEIEMHYFSPENIESKFISAVQSGNPPDIVRVQDSWVEFFAKRGYIKSITGLNDEDYSEIAKELVTFENKVFAIPQEFWTIFVFYNTNLLKKNNVFLKKEALNISYFKENILYFPVTDFRFFSLFFSYDDDKKIFSYENLKILDDIKLTVLSNPKLLEFTLNDSYDKMIDEFKNGNYPMILAFSWSENDILKGKEFKNANNLGKLNVNFSKTSSVFPKTIFSYNYVIAKDSKFLNDSFNFIQFINSQEAQRKFFLVKNYFFTRKSLLKENNTQFIGDLLKKNENTLEIRQKLQFYSLFNSQMRNFINEQKETGFSQKKFEKEWEKIEEIY